MNVAQLSPALQSSSVLQIIGGFAGNILGPGLGPGVGTGGGTMIQQKIEIDADMILIQSKI